LDLLKDYKKKRAGECYVFSVEQVKLKVWFFNNHIVFAVFILQTIKIKLLTLKWYFNCLRTKQKLIFKYIRIFKRHILIILMKN
jgi:hypothetical protein